MIFLNLFFLLLAVLVALYGVLVFVSLVAAQIRHGNKIGFAVGFMSLLISAFTLTIGVLGIIVNANLVFASF
jgi:hypothetical protein